MTPLGHLGATHPNIHVIPMQTGSDHLRYCCTCLLLLQVMMFNLVGIWF
jgi:hypothetical protein